MKLAQSSLLIVLFLFSHASVASDANTAKDGEALYKAHCSSCHGNTGGMDMRKRVAPPIVAVRMHYLGSYPEKDAFIMAVASNPDWIVFPPFTGGKVYRMDNNTNRRHFHDPPPLGGALGMA